MRLNLSKYNIFSEAGPVVRIRIRRIVVHVQIRYTGLRSIVQVASDVRYLPARIAGTACRIPPINSIQTIIIAYLLYHGHKRDMNLMLTYLV